MQYLNGNLIRKILYLLNIIEGIVLNVLYISAYLCAFPAFLYLQISHKCIRIHSLLIIETSL